MEHLLTPYTTTYYYYTTTKDSYIVVDPIKVEFFLRCHLKCHLEGEFHL